MCTYSCKYRFTERSWWFVGSWRLEVQTRCRAAPGEVPVWVWVWGPKIDVSAQRWEEREHGLSHSFLFYSGLHRLGEAHPQGERQAAVPALPFNVTLTPSQTHLEEFHQTPGHGMAQSSSQVQLPSHLVNTSNGCFYTCAFVSSLSIPLPSDRLLLRPKHTCIWDRPLACSHFHPE